MLGDLLGPIPGLFQGLLTLIIDSLGIFFAFFSF